MKDVEFIKKDKKNDFHGYNYASEEAIKVALHKQFVEKGILFRFSATDYTITTVQGEKGEKLITNVKFAYSFTDVDTGEDVGGVFIGSGEDKGDKGVYKAITGAIKYILTSSFLIPTGDDPERHEPPKPLTKTQISELKKVAKELGKDYEDKLESSLTNGKITVKNYHKALAQLQNAVRVNKKDK